MSEFPPLQACLCNMGVPLSRMQSFPRLHAKTPDFWGFLTFCGCWSGDRDEAFNSMLQHARRCYCVESHHQSFPQLGKSQNPRELSALVVRREKYNRVHTPQPCRSMCWDLALLKQRRPIDRATRNTKKIPKTVGFFFVLAVPGCSDVAVPARLCHIMLHNMVSPSLVRNFVGGCKRHTENGKTTQQWTRDVGAGGWQTGRWKRRCVTRLCPFLSLHRPCPRLCRNRSFFFFFFCFSFVGLRGIGAKPRLPDRPTVCCATLLHRSDALLLSSLGFPAPNARFLVGFFVFRVFGCRFPSKIVSSHLVSCD
jgi:hypothetical protein